MSKSYDNYIALDDSAKEMVGKTMSVSDELMWRYFMLLTEHEICEIETWKNDVASGKTNPRDLKLRLAGEITEFYHGQTAAAAAAQAFVDQFSKGNLPDDIPEYEVVAEDLKNGKLWIIRVLTASGITKSNGEARRLIAGGGVYLNGEKINDPDFEWVPGSGDLLKAGKRHYRKLRLQ